MIRRQLLFLAMVAAAAGGILACHREKEGEQVARGEGVRPFPGNPTCPDHSGALVWIHSDSGTITSIPLAGPTTLIPEFNDCQRLIDTKHKYGALAAIWAPTAYLGHLLDSLRDGKAVAAAAIHAWDGDYPALGIKQMWNCLYLLGNPDGTSLHALMGTIGSPADCVGTRDPGQLGATTPLVVDREQIAGLTEGDYPDVGRWDRDKDKGEPTDYIGLKCGDGWCEFHAKGNGSFASSARYSLPSATAPGRRKVFEVKGWYDEQYLDLGSSTAKIPTSSVGTIVPDPGLDTLRMQNFAGMWMPAGVVSLSVSVPKYQSVYGLKPGKLPHGDNGDNLTAVSLCWAGRTDAATCPALPAGLPASCTWDPTADVGNKWYSRSQVSGSSPVYKCVIRHDHSSLGIHIPGTARWNWQEDDVTQWYRCDNGCCAIKP
jgi:hypothetical protein